MLRTYKAIIKNDRLQWLEEKPCNVSRAKSQLVHVTVLDRKFLGNKKKSGTLVEFFQKSPLYGSGIDLDRAKDNKSLGRMI
jgi:hypothetical protein